MVPLSTKSALDKLIHASRAVQRRNGVKDAETKRIKEAVRLLREGYPPVDATGAKRQSIYLDFLRKVLEENGRPMVILCAVGLGLSAIAVAKESVRLDLPYEISEHASLDNPVLHRLARLHFSSTLHPESFGSATDQEREQESSQQTSSMMSKIHTKLSY